MELASSFLGKILYNSLIMSMAILLMAALSRTLLRKTSPRIRMACWLVIALGFVVPVRPLPYVVTVPVAESPILNDAAFLEGLSTARSMESMEGANQRRDALGDAEDGSLWEDSFASFQTASAGGKGTIGYEGVLTCIWAMGFLVTLMVYSVKHWMFLRMVRRWGRPVDDGVVERMREVGRKVGLRRRVHLLASPVITTPIMIGMFRPWIILPVDTVTDDKLRYVLMHEALHVKCGDIWVKGLSLLALAFHWFNPLVYLMNRTIVTESEYACDLSVLRHLDEGERFGYGETLLFVAKRGRRAETLLSTSFHSGRDGLKRRLKNIMDYSTPKRWLARSCIAVLVVGLFSAIGLTGFRIETKSVGVKDRFMATPSSRQDELWQIGLKDVYKDYFMVGTAVNSWTLQGELLDLTTKHFNAFTFENDMKPDQVQGKEGEFDYERVDKVTELLNGNGVHMVGHSLAWHQQTPQWMWGSRVKAKERLESHVENVLRHVGRDMVAIDVVNEAFGSAAVGDDWRMDLRTEGWYSVLGSDFVEIAFRKADEVRQAIGRPDLKLYYNEYGLEYEGKAKAVYNMVKELRQKGVAIDGIGMQGHFDQNVSVLEVKRSLDLFHTIPDIEVSITELDVAITRSEHAEQLSPKEEEMQGLLYAKLFSLFRQYAKGSANPDESKRLIARVTLWGVTDDGSWRAENHPLLFGGDGEPKQAYYAVADPDGYLADDGKLDANGG